MKNLLKVIPLPISGLMLACFTMANLLSSYSKLFFHLFSLIGIAIFILILLKIIVFKESVLAQLNHPVISSVIPTYSMGIMLMSVYLKTFIGNSSIYIWYIGIILHIILLINYTVKFIFNFKMKKIFPSIFIVYVGLVVSSITAKTFNALIIGKIFFCFGFISFVVLLFLILYRLRKYPELPTLAKPTIAILAAPASLNLAGYLSIIETKSISFIYLLLGISLFLTFSILVYLPKLKKGSFIPGFSAFTFPFAISALAVKKVYAFLSLNSENILWLKYLVIFEEIIALTLVIYVLINYIKMIKIDYNNLNISTKKLI